MSVVLGVLGLGGCGGASGRVLRLTAIPRSALVDEPRVISVSGLRPGEHVTVSARTLTSHHVWVSSATYAATVRGIVDLASSAPISGTYRGASAMGLFWSETRAGKAAGSAAQSVTRLTATTPDGQSAATTVVQIYRERGATERQMTSKRDGFVGEYFTPARALASGPAVVLWGGSEGGDSMVPSAELLASHGISALTVAYFDEPGLPCSLSNIPIEYFVNAIRWIKRQPGIDPHRVWGWALSRGTEALGLIAAHWPTLLHGIIEDSASSVINASYAGSCEPETRTTWTIHSKAVPFDPKFGPAGLAPAFADPATIAFARFNGPVLLLSGAADRIWPSPRYENNIMSELRHDRAAHIHLNYRHAGHAVLAPPYEPIDDLAQLGGTRAGYGAAELQDWPASLRFITQH